MPGRGGFAVGVAEVAPVTQRALAPVGVHEPVGDRIAPHHQRIHQRPDHADQDARADQPGEDLPRLHDAALQGGEAEAGQRQQHEQRPGDAVEIGAQLRHPGVAEFPARASVDVQQVGEHPPGGVLGSVDDGGQARGGGGELDGADQGVVMHFNDLVARFEGDGRLERVVTRSGRVVEADVAVVGIGTEPAVHIMAGTGLDRPGGIPVGPTLETSLPGVFAVGDVARHEHPVFGPVRVEHFDNALKMGEAVARNMLGAEVVFDDPHWFWSDQYDVQIQMAGFAPTWDRMVVRGSLEDRSFCAFLLDADGVLRSSVSIAWPRDVRRWFELIRGQVRPDPAALADPEVDLRTLVAE